MRNLYLALSELLKHFWHCFPPTTQDLEAKALRMHQALQRFKMARLQPFEVSVKILSKYILYIINGAVFVYF